MSKNVFSFNGRIRRRDFIISYLIIWAVSIAVSFVVSLLSAAGGEILAFAIYTVVYIPVVWYILAQGAKRCHDLGKSGWWQIIPLYFLILLFKPGQEGDNAYGSDPKGMQALAA